MDWVKIYYCIQRDKEQSVKIIITITVIIIIIIIAFFCVIIVYVVTTERLSCKGGEGVIVTQVIRWVWVITTHISLWRGGG